MRRRKGEPSTSGFKYICRLARRVIFISFKLPSVSLGDDPLLDFVSRRLAFCPVIEEFLNRNVLTLEVRSVFVAACWEVVTSIGGDTVAAAVVGRLIIFRSWEDGIEVGGGMMRGCLEEVAPVMSMSLRVTIGRCWWKMWSWSSDKVLNRWIPMKNLKDIYWNNSQLIHSAVRVCQSLSSDV